MRRRSKNILSEDGPKVPTWIVSFTDMITLLLSFFVLLQAFAHTRDPELFAKGQGSFLRAIKTFGLPGWLYGRQDRPKRQYTKVKHTTKEAKNKLPRNKMLDAEDENIRKAFQTIQKAIRTQCSDLPDVPVEMMAAPIRFEPGGSDLDLSAREWLRRFALDLRNSRTPEHTSIHVMGLAPDVRSARQQWMLSAQRARAVAAVLRYTLSSGSGPGVWEISSRGAGAGGKMWGKLGDESKRFFIVIAIEGAERDGRR